MKFAAIINTLTLTAMVGIGAYHIQEAQAQQAVQNIPEEDKHCLQQNIFFEARNQSTLGQVAVAWVTLNRVENSSYPTSICQVVKQGLKMLTAVWFGISVNFPGIVMEKAIVFQTM